MEHCQVMRIVAGTTNSGKISALRALLALSAEVIASPIPGSPLVDEAGGTIADVAAAKANAWSRWLANNGVPLPVIVTDGGLTIPALPGWDPTRTRRFAGEGKTPLQLAQALLERTIGLTGNDRRIGWTEVAVIVRPDGQTVTYAAESPPGVLATTVGAEALEETDGFWVPAVWLCPEYDMKRLIDLTTEERTDRTDHWDRLGTALREDLRIHSCVSPS